MNYEERHTAWDTFASWAAMALLVLVLGLMFFSLFTPSTQLEKDARLCHRMHTTFGQPYETCMSARR